VWRSGLSASVEIHRGESRAGEVVRSAAPRWSGTRRGTPAARPAGRRLDAGHGERVANATTRWPGATTAGRRGSEEDAPGPHHRGTAGVGRPGGSRLECAHPARWLAGVEVDPRAIPLVDGGGVHEARVVMGVATPVRVASRAARPRSSRAARPRSTRARHRGPGYRSRVAIPASLGAFARGGPMRVVHLDPPVGTFPYVPVCGDWGSPDTDGTKEARGVTCLACREVMGSAPRAGPPPVSVPLRPA
jgi:hypothetical protein